MKSAYISLIIGPRESFGMFGFDLGLLLQGQMRIAKRKSTYNSFIIGLRGLGW